MYSRVICKARMGRRAKEDDEPAGDVAAASASAGGGSGGGGDKPTAKRRGGWGDDPPRTAGSGGRPRQLAEDELGDDNFREKRFSDSDDDADTAAIPELKEEVAAPAVNEAPEMAMAPSIAVNRVATYRELDFDLNRHASFATLDNEIDLKLLTRCLAADQDLAEPDEYWDWDRLFTEVTSDLLTTEAGNEADEQAALVLVGGGAGGAATSTAGASAGGATGGGGGSGGGTNSNAANALPVT